MEMLLINRTFDFFGFDFAYYSLFALIGFLTTFVIVNRRWKKAKFHEKELDNFFFLSVIIGILGARTWFVIFSPHLGVFDIITLNMEGLAIQGGAIAVMIFAFNYFKSGKSATFIGAMDIIAPVVLLGHGIGRWGNFINQEVYGHAVNGNSLTFLPQFIVDQMFINGEYRFPLFLMEFVINTGLFILILFVIEKKFKGIRGLSFASYLIGYGILRSVLENFRDPQDIMVFAGFIRVSVLVSLGFIGVGGFVLYKYAIPDFKKLSNEKYAQKVAQGEAELKEVKKIAKEIIKENDL